jgi:hypothetical protein
MEQHYASIGTLRDADDGFFGLVLRLNISSMRRLGPTYSMFILKLAFRMSGICNWVLCLEWKRRLIQSSTSAIRPVATTMLYAALVRGKVRLQPRVTYSEMSESDCRICSSVMRI